MAIISLKTAFIFSIIDSTCHVKNLSLAWSWGGTNPKLFHGITALCHHRNNSPTHTDSSEYAHMPEHTLSYPHTTHLSHTKASITLYMHHTQTRNIPTEGHCICAKHTQKPPPTCTHTTPHTHTHTHTRKNYLLQFTFLSFTQDYKQRIQVVCLNWNIVDFQNHVSFRCREGVVIQYVCRLCIIQQGLCLIRLWSLWPPDT